MIKNHNRISAYILLTIIVFAVGYITLTWLDNKYSTPTEEVKGEPVSSTEKITSIDKDRIPVETTVKKIETIPKEKIEPKDEVVTITETVVPKENPEPIPRSTNPRDTKHYIPPQAFQYFETIKKETKEIIPYLPYPEYIAGLIEHESCITLTHSRCWSPKSQFKTKRELGLGMLQLTKAFRKDGSLRFDSLTELRNRHQERLKEMSWNNLTSRPDLQIRAGVLMTDNNYKALSAMKDPYQRLAASDAAYNGGLGSVRKRRRICGLKANCDPQFWFENLELVIVKSTKPLYGNRSAQQINTEHVAKVLKETMPKYKPYFR